MKEIKLFGKYGLGKAALVSDEDYESLAKYRWHVTNYGYATTFHNRKAATMHRVVMNFPAYPEFQIDHINRNKLDNRRDNLRICSMSENLINRLPPKQKKRKNLDLPFGVYWDRRRKYRPYIAQITRNKKTYRGGTFATPEEAGSRYLELLRMVHY